MRYRNWVLSWSPTRSRVECSDMILLALSALALATPDTPAPCAGIRPGGLLTAAPTLSSPAPMDRLCFGVNLDIAGRGSFGFPDTGLTRRLELARGRGEFAVYAPGGVSTRLALIPRRTGGTAGYIGVAGESVVPIIQIAEARIDLPTLGLAFAGGMIDDIWLMGTQVAWQFRPFARTMSETHGWLDRADIGGWVSWTSPRNIASVTISLTTGEGLQARERNEGKNTTAVFTVRPLAPVVTNDAVLEVSAFLRDGSTGALESPEDRYGARITSQHHWIGSGIEVVGGTGLDGDATLQPVGVSGWVRTGPDLALPILGWTTVQAAWAQRGEADTLSLTYSVGAGVHLPWTETPIGRPAYVALAYEGSKLAENATPVAGSFVEASGHTMWLQLGFRANTLLPVFFNR